MLIPRISTLYKWMQQSEIEMKFETFLQNGKRLKSAMEAYHRRPSALVIWQKKKIFWNTSAGMQKITEYL